MATAVPVDHVAAAVEAAPSWAVEARKRDWLSTVRPWTEFFGIGASASGAVPFAVPRPTVLTARMAANVELYLSNYALVRVFAGYIDCFPR